MATWREMSQDCLKAARLLLQHGCLRRSISSSYYAAYSAVAGALKERGVTFAHGWNNPAHDQLPELILNNLALPDSSRFRLNKAVRILRRAREDADYRVRAPIDRALALDCLRHVLRVFEILEIDSDGTE